MSLRVSTTVVSGHLILGKQNLSWWLKLDIRINHSAILNNYGFFFINYVKWNIVRRKSKITIIWQYNGHTPWERSNAAYFLINYFTLYLSILSSIDIYDVERTLVFFQCKIAVSMPNLIFIPFNIEGLPKSIASYFIMLDHNIRGRFWLYVKKSWTFPLYSFTPFYCVIHGRGGAVW